MNKYNAALSILVMVFFTIGSIIIDRRFDVIEQRQSDIATAINHTIRHNNQMDSVQTEYFREINKRFKQVIK